MSGSSNPARISSYIKVDLARTVLPVIFPTMWPLTIKTKTLRRPSLTQQIQTLERKIARKESEMDLISDKFFRAGGTCCPGCGEPGYRELERAQDRRWDWLKILKTKLEDRHNI